VDPTWRQVGVEGLASDGSRRSRPVTSDTPARSKLARNSHGVARRQPGGSAPVELQGMGLARESGLGTTGRKASFRFGTAG
jgi:hypothetical protein